MTDDLATQSLGTIPAPTTLQERRQQYDDWLLTGRRANRPMGVQTRVDDGPHTNNLTDRRTKAAEDAASTLLNPLPPGAVVRTDEGEKDPDVGDEIRLGFGKALLAKAEGASPETAALIANAARAMIGPMIARADDGKAADAEVDPAVNGKPGTQPKPPPKPGSSPLNRRDPASAGRHSADGDDGHEEKERKMADDKDAEPTLREVMDAMKGISKRLDAIEKGKGDAGSEDNPEDGPPLDPQDGIPRALAADAERVHKESFGWRAKHDRLNKIVCDSEVARFV
jgi:hypothetical protein